MFIIMGGTGHVGSATASALLDQGQKVTIVTRDRAKAETWTKRGAVIAVADVHDPDALRAVLKTGRRAFLLSPPAPTDTDTDAVERATVRNILEAVAGSGLEKIVAESTYGAQPGDRIGDLNTLHELEVGLDHEPIPHTIIRAAYYFTNWDAMLKPARENGVLSTMFPADFQIPMVSPIDLGNAAARLLMEPVGANEVVYVEGPERYSSADVAAAFADVLGRPVKTVVTPREDWEAAFKTLGFSDAAAKSYARMTATVVDQGSPDSHDPVRGTVTLREHIAALAGRRDG